MTAGTRPQPRPGGVKRRPVAPERTVQPVAASRAGGTAFMWLVAIIALGSAMCLLVLNTLRSEQAFTLTSLQGRVAQLDDQQQALQSDISALSAPEAIALKADSMGMVHASSVRFIQRSNGKLLGVSTSPQAGAAIAVNTLPQSAASSAASDVVAAGSIGTHVGNAPTGGTQTAKPSVAPSKSSGTSTKSALTAPGVTKRVGYAPSVGARTRTVPGAQRHVTRHLAAPTTKK